MTHDAQTALLRAALTAAERGWHVFPCRPGSKPPALHGEKTCTRTDPCTTGHVKWEQRATTDPARIRAAWSRAPFNVGIATGPSGLVVIDLDVPKDKNSSDAPCGATTFAALCERAGHAVPNTYRVRTASGGEHLYFTCPPGARLGNTAGTVADSVDTRAWGGYVVAAGSVTAAGWYEALCASLAAPLPAWLLSILEPAPARPEGSLRLPAVGGSRAALAALEAECAVVTAAPEGLRNTVLNRCAFKVGRFVAWGDLPRQTVEDAFQGAGEAVGLTAAECRTTIRSALDGSIRKARPRQAA
ncbi:bifunctional DNA primase/polymerase [Streptomyces collinus]|uniref:Hyphothetical protein n=1 Tax=Streptomyces collinus (strain DSM 40733 / Tue 365) TaxID=1214242 RepID=S5UZH2_STRC3|nr:bifunctional DNA primase/polymerase [Streptomyces collinus]AGS71166.1 hyphothetical protein [Streptomyces collinus Tu 365]UJA09817.1 bifunctional DNA primase/polymerase [Streptomyces collinus]UJA15319.1 bifunctional DNA primase/polymerase [Streptomyces collinus]